MTSSTAALSEPGGPRAVYRAALEHHGRETMSFEGLKSGMAHWVDPDTGATLAYADVAGAWVGVGLPLAADPEAAASRFEAAARTAGKRALFFGAERSLPGWASLPIGEQPVFGPGDWERALARAKSLREQLRRARKKGVVVRAVDAVEAVAMAREVSELARGWLDTHHVDPLGFVVAVDPFYEAPSHRYFVAEQDGRLVGFLSAVPIPAIDGWLIEDIFRAPDAPNGTTETLIDTFMRAEPDTHVTLGLAPLTGELPWWLRLARVSTRPLYDFEGLASFKRRLHAPRWTPVWLLHRGLAPLALLPVLRAFAAGSVVRFGARSLVRHPSGPPFAMALPLAPWVALLATFAATGNAGYFGFDAPRLWAWVAFDVLLMVVLYLAARRPRPRRLLLALSLAFVDAVLSVGQLAVTGLGGGLLEGVLRGLAVAAPLLGTVALVWAWSRSLSGASRRSAAARSVQGGSTWTGRSPR